jgi:predicted RNase H-like HicB family nuclease
MAMDETAHTNDYRVEVVRSGAWWAITVPALDGVFSQTKRLDQIEDAAREAISLMLEIEESNVGTLDVIVTPPPGVAELLETLEASGVAADEATRTAVDTRRETVEMLRADGFPLRDIGALIGLSHQRVSQILGS